MSAPILKVRKFHDLMPFRVREVLLVSSPYDAYILEEDGHLTEQVFLEYKELSLSSSPRFTYAGSAEDASRLLEQRNFDLVLTMSRLATTDAAALGRLVKRARPGIPVVLLALDRTQLARMMEKGAPDDVDGVFLWSGNAKILLAIIKYVEDRANVDHDLAHGDVRVVIMVEDSPRYYSAFLASLYSELMAQSRSLYAEGVNELHRLMCMKSRPKILHATSYEAGLELYRRYQRHVLAVISDVRIPRLGKPDPDAGLDFARYVRRYDPSLTVLLQSAEPENAERARALGALFIDKNSPSLLAEIGNFLKHNLGFGDFIFRRPDGTEVDRARDVHELEEKLETVPDECVAYHAAHNHFSVWLMARSEFELAEKLRPKRMEDFNGVAEVRDYLVGALSETHEATHLGIIADFDPDDFEHSPFTRIGNGSIGGKARGVAFLNMNFAGAGLSDIEGLRVTVPKTIALTTEIFDRFLERNGLHQFAYACEDDRLIAERFLKASLPHEIRESLRLVLGQLREPLAVRSSSLLEDSLHQPFAGIYNTIMIPNDQEDPEERLARLCAAIKLVYASTFSRNAKSYLENTGYRAEEEKMGIVIQTVVGWRRGDRFYPAVSGVAQSYNYYPIGPQKPEEGVVHLALGLGRLVVDGGESLRFSPAHPGVLPQFGTPKAYLEHTQRGFFAIRMGPDGASDSAVEFFDLKAAEDDGTLSFAGGVYSLDDGRIVDDLSSKGPRVVTFHNILKYRAFPLPEALTRVLQIAKEGLGCDVEIEFACDLGDWGKAAPRSGERRPPTLYLLQVRPFVTRHGAVDSDALKVPRDRCLCRTGRALGNGVTGDVRDVVYVDPERWDAADNKAIAAEVGVMNDRLSREKRPYVLIGPGRWGSADEWLGIPVQWSQISGVRLMVEASPKGYNVDPSQGTHFFQNITSLEVGYMTLPPGAEKKDGADEFVDWAWLAAQRADGETGHLRHVRLDAPLTVVLDAKTGRGLVAKPQ